MLKPPPLRVFALLACCWRCFRRAAVLRRPLRPEIRDAPDHISRSSSSASISCSASPASSVSATRRSSAAAPTPSISCRRTEARQCAGGARRRAAGWRRSPRSSSAPSPAHARLLFHHGDAGGRADDVLAVPRHRHRQGLRRRLHQHQARADVRRDAARLRRPAAFYYVCCVALVLAFSLLFALARTPFGRVVQGFEGERDAAVGARLQRL